MVQVGDKIPDVELVEGGPGTKVNLAKELKGKGLIIGVPAAFSMYLSMAIASLTSLLSTSLRSIVILYQHSLPIVRPWML
jgi:hypothetical protein